MVLETPLEPLWEWLPGALLTWCAAVGLLAIAWSAAALLYGVARHGPTIAVRRFVDRLADGGRDWFKTSPRRVWALSQLAIRESVRNRIVVALAIFAGLLMFAGWFLSGRDDPAKLYIESIFTWTAMLVTLVALLVAVFSLPNDIKHRTIYTVVTKPVRAHEIVLGRLIGFSLVAAGLLAIMSAAGYAFIDRMLDHSHTVDPASFTDVDLPPVGGQFDEHTIVEMGRLNKSNGHHHRFSLNAGGVGVSDNAAGHWHAIVKDVTPRIQSARVDSGDATRVLVRFSEPMDPVVAANKANYSAGEATVKAASLSADNRTATLELSAVARVGETRIAVSDAVKSRLGRELAAREPVVVTDRDADRDVSAYKIGPPEDLLRSRVPQYGRLRFLGPKGEEKSRGISVGSEWDYRSYIEGGTQAAAIWTFDDVSAERLGDFPRLELTVRVFRTHKGRIDQTVRGSIVLRNPADPRIATRPREFASQDGPVSPLIFTRVLSGTNAQGQRAELDLYRDLVAAGRIEVVVQCVESGQFFGVAQADAYLLAREGSYAWNYAKATFTLLLPVLIVVAVAVTMSTLLSSPVAMLATATMLIAGLFTPFVEKIANNQLHGGGVFESAYRLQYRMNLMQPLEPGGLTTAIKMADEAIRSVLWCVTHMLPDLTTFWRVDYLANGFNVPDEHLLILTLKALAYILPLVVAGYFFLKTREVAA